MVVNLGPASGNRTTRRMMRNRVSLFQHFREIVDIAGKEARRALRAGEPVRPTDLKRPTLIAKGSTVTMVFEMPGIHLTAVGRALNEGAQGDTITVLNPTSYRQVEATVISAGTVRVGSPNASLAANTLAAVHP